MISSTTSFERYASLHVQDLELCRLACPEQFAERWIVTGVLDSRVEGVFDEIEKDPQEGESEILGILLGTVRNRGHKRQDVLGCDRGQLYITKMALEVAENELIISERIFFHIHPLVIEKMGNAL